MRIFKSRWFAKFVRKERITNAKLCEAVRNTEQGIIDADYGGGVIKQRIARPNQGKSGGYRSVILYRRGVKSFFVYGFPKNKRDNIDADEEREFKEWARVIFSFSDDELAKVLTTGAYNEVMCDD